MQRDIRIDYDRLFRELEKQVPTIENSGAVATYIPDLGNVDPQKFGLHLTTIENRRYGLGACQEKFSIQSIAKVLALTLAFSLEKDRLWERVGVEPSGTSFNSLVQLEYEKGIPRNPLINAGALVVCDILISTLDRPREDFLIFARRATGLPGLNFCARIAESERRTGFKNVALVNLMKAFGNIRNDIERVLDFYFHLCSIEMSCEELSPAFLYLAAEGVQPVTGETITTASQSRRINAIMQLCGFYDEAGEFAFRVGLPGKSGVGGGIVAIHPGIYSVAVWSPRLNARGNSCRGMRVLEYLTTETRSSIF